MTIRRMMVRGFDFDSLPEPTSRILQPLHLLISTFTLLDNPTILMIYDSESCGSTVGFCMLPILCASIHPSPSNCLSNGSTPSRESEYTHVLGWSWYGALILYGWTD